MHANGTYGGEKKFLKSSTDKKLLKFSNLENFEVMERVESHI